MKYFYVVLISLFVFSADGQSSSSGSNNESSLRSPCNGGRMVYCYTNLCSGQSDGAIKINEANNGFSYTLIKWGDWWTPNVPISTITGIRTPLWDNLSAGQYKIKVSKGRCSEYTDMITLTNRSMAQPVTTITTTGCEALSLTCSPSSFGWYWQTSAGGTSRSNSSTAAYSVTANTTYYLRGYNGSCWSSALVYTPVSRIPAQPVSTITPLACGALSLTCSPSNSNWYWQTSDGGTGTGNPSTAAYSINVNTFYYLRAYNGSCWSSALRYIQVPRAWVSQIPARPVSVITTLGCDALSLTCSPSNAGWYWQTSEGGTSRSNPSTAAYSVNANTTYYLRAYNGSCWSSALSYTPVSRIPAQPVSVITTLGCDALSLTCSPSNAGWYWQTSAGGTSRSNPSTAAYSVNATTTYYLRAYNGSCWSSALVYTPTSPIPAQPVSVISTLGCDALSLTCSPSNAGWYWQISAGGTGTANPSTTAYSVNATTTYYLRAYNGSCWSSALSYAPVSRIPAQPVSVITTLGCDALSLTCSPSNSGWYWQTSDGGTGTGNPSTAAYSVNANTTYYLRAYNGSCWSSALVYTPVSRVPARPVSVITTLGCDALSLTCSPSNAGWYWQTSAGGTSTGNPSTAAYSVNANTTYYLRAYNGSCWSSALSYAPVSRIPAQPVSVITTLGCEALSLTCSPSNAGWYWQTSEGGTSTGNPSTTAYSVTATTTYYLRAYNGSCWSSALSYTPVSRIPAQPVSVITTLGCEALSLTCSPSNSGWYWQTSDSGTSTGNPSTSSLSVNANTTYYLRAYNGSCWSSALVYTPVSRIPAQPVSVITTLGCEALSLTCSPSNANWYWQISAGGTSTDNPSTAAYSVNANTTYYLRAYNGSCWSSALVYTPVSRIPAQPVSVITTLGCDALSLTCSPSNAGWYWQTSAGGTGTANPSTAAYSVNANTPYYLRAYNGSCWSSALSYTPVSRIPAQPVSVITTLGCDALSLTCSPSNSNWYWQTSAGGTSTDNPSTTAYSVNANTTYYLRAYNGSCWSSALVYTPVSRIPAQPVSAITTLGCDALSLTCSPSNANWYWQTSEGGTSTDNPSTTAYSVNANTTYYLRAYNGSCWSSALSYTTPASPIPAQPVSVITTLGCEALSLTCSPSNANWYWQTSAGGTSTSNPSTTAYSVNANTTYYLRAYNGSCWSSALVYTPVSRIPAQPVSAITTLGCDALSLTCSPSNANWYWQISAGGTSTDNPSTAAYSVNATTTYYLRAYNGSCWSSALVYTPTSPIPARPVSVITTLGCDALSLTCSPSNADWYWQTSAGGTSTSYPSTSSLSVNANTTYYLRAYNGSCWSSALVYTPVSRIPARPVSVITTLGCDAISLTCSPSNAGWYWQTSAGGTSRSNPSTAAYSVNANTTYYLRAYNGSCWSSALSYTPTSPIPAQPVSVITTLGCEALSLTCSPSNAGWYWQISAGGTSASYPSTTAYSVTAHTTYYLRAYNGSCWSSALVYTPVSRIPAQPVSVITTLGCDALSLTCSPSNAGWYWQTSEGGTSTSNPSTSSLSVNANTTYYLRAYNGSCWSSALVYTPTSPIPARPVSVITTLGCDALSLTCSPSNAGWYWQTSAGGTSTANPSTSAYSVNANTTYYLRAYNGSCWSSALVYTPTSPIPARPVSVITTLGCDALSLTCSPSNAGWYWQTSAGGTSTSNPSTSSLSVNANTTYYLRAYNGSCWSSALVYTPVSRIPAQPVSVITTLGCEALSLTCSPSNAGWYWQTSAGGTGTANPSTAAYSVNANTPYYLRAYNGSCWSSALSYTPVSRIPAQPVSVITTLGCDALSLTCSPSNSNWYWQTSAGGTSTDNPSTAAYSVNANTTYYLRAYNGSCWSSALVYTPVSRIPAQPVSVITTLGCDALSLTCSPSNANWYWQTSEGGTSTDNPSTTAYSVNATTPYYLRAYNGSCWSSALSYTTPASPIPAQPVSVITTLGCEALSLTCSPSNANWYWQTSAGGTSTSNPSTTAYSVNANTTYYLRAYNGSCWSSALVYTPVSRIPAQPVSAITTLGCDALSLTCSPSNANWYWQTSEGGTSTDNPSTTAYSVNATTPYYLRAYNGSCWSSALSYTTPASPIPAQPVSVITTLGCEALSLTCSPSNANWYWQTSAGGTSTSNPSTTAYSVNANTTYYLRAYNGSCWSSALSYTPVSRIPAQPVSAITTLGCDALSLTCSPSNANWYWQTSAGGTSTSYPSTSSLSVNANTTYYLRAYNGSCWSSALVYTPTSPIPAQPVSEITTLGCEALSLTCSPSNAGWYWQTSAGGTSTSNPSTAAYSVNANTTYYLRAYNGSCWSSALVYTPVSRIPAQPVSVITTLGCDALSLTCSPSNAGWYWQTSEGGTSLDNPSTAAYSVNANTTYYLRAYNGSCWSSALVYTPVSRIPAQPVSVITTLGCDALSLTCSPSNANWYWQTSAGGTSTSYPSTSSLSVNANTTYYLRAYNGSCWSSALVYTPTSPIPAQPVSEITTLGCEALSLTCSPSNADWYWQTSAGGTSTSYPSTSSLSVNANTTYYLRAYNGSCWSSALVYTPTSPIPARPVSVITTLGCDALSLTCSPSNAGWYWQTSAGGTSTANPSTTAYSVNANTTYYLRAYSGSCWSSALSYTPTSPIPAQPVSVITTLGCDALSLTCSPSNANWYWQISAGGTSTDNPSTAAYSVTANTTYYLRAYNGSCWSSALVYTPVSRIPAQPVSVITTLGCDALSLTCSPSNAGWYWQTSAGGTSLDNPSTAAYSVNATTTYYLRAYNGSCWSSALVYTPVSRIPAQPVSAITTLGCDALSLTCSPSNANWYWQISAGGTSTDNPSTAAYSVNATTTYYLRAYNGSCWSNALSYLVESQIPAQPAATITPTGCEVLSLTCNISDADWYWQTSDGGTSTGNPSTVAYSVNANTTYYLRAYNGSCWSSALSYTTPESPMPAQPAATITPTGCDALSLTCSPSNSGWYWQTSAGGRSTGNPSITAYSVNATTTYYLRAYNGSCWSSALSYTTPESPIPDQPVATIMPTGCEALSLTCSPSNSGWYWQTSDGGRSTGNPSTAAYSVNATTTYYLRAYNGSCWSSALSYTPASPKPLQPVAAITTSGCETLTLTCSPSEAGWYWQTSSGGTSTSYSSSTAFSVMANTTYYLRAHNGNCWSEGVSYTPAVRRPAPPATTISEHGGCNRNLVLSSSPSHEDWYWQSSSDGTIIEESRRSTTGFTVTTSGTWYLRAYNAATQCWSTPVEKTVTVSTRSGPVSARLAGYEFCGSNSGKVELLESQTGLTYQLMAARGSIGSLAGTGSALQWTGLSADTYWVVATYPDEPRCTTEMRNRVRVEAIAEATADFDSKRILCATKFTPALNLGLGTAISYNWGFGDTKTSTDASPVHSYSSDGTYTVTMAVRYYVDCSGRATVNCPCGQEFSRQVTKSITTTTLPESESFEDASYTYQIPVYDKVLSSSSTTFNSSWPHPDAVNTKSSYVTGVDGVWRVSGSYVFKADRSQSVDVWPATDGSYTLQQFNWDAPETSLSWLKTEEVVEYSPFSKPLMVEDVLQVPASALYDYGGYLQSAQGVNMKNREMAFTGFEYMNDYKGENTTGRESGNWNFGLSPVNTSTYYKAHGRGNYIFVEAPLKKLEGRAGVYVRAKHFWWSHRYYQYRKIECRQASESKKETHLVVQEPPVFGDAWEGWVYVLETVESSAVPSFSTRAHTGQSSLMISENKTFPQEILRLDSGRSYSLSAWASSESTSVPAGIDVLFKNKNGVEVARFSGLPEGPLIEGWQQIRGTFICPKNDLKVSLIFKNGGGTAYYDDLRLHPSQGNMESYVYDVKNYKLLARLDAENFATLYYYDKEGQLRLTKKETTDGVKTLSEMVDYVKVKN